MHAIIVIQFEQLQKPLDLESYTKVRFENEMNAQRDLNYFLSTRPKIKVILSMKHSQFLS